MFREVKRLVLAAKKCILLEQMERLSYEIQFNRSLVEEDLSFLSSFYNELNNLEDEYAKLKAEVQKIDENLNEGT